MLFQATMTAVAVLFQNYDVSHFKNSHYFSLSAFSPRFRCCLKDVVPDKHIRTTQRKPYQTWTTRTKDFVRFLLFLSVSFFSCSPVVYCRTSQLASSQFLTTSSLRFNEREHETLEILNFYEKISCRVSSFISTYIVCIEIYYFPRYDNHFQYIRKSKYAFMKEPYSYTPAKLGMYREFIRLPSNRPRKSGNTNAPKLPLPRQNYTYKPFLRQ